MTISFLENTEAIRILSSFSLLPRTSESQSLPSDYRGSEAHPGPEDITAPSDTSSHNLIQKGEYSTGPGQVSNSLFQ